MNLVRKCTLLEQVETYWCEVKPEKARSDKSQERKVGVFKYPISIHRACAR